MVRSVGRTAMAEKYVYRACHAYAPTADNMDDHITLDVDDKLEVTLPLTFSLQGTLENPNGWLQGLNINKSCFGYFPASYVVFVNKVCMSSPKIPPRKLHNNGPLVDGGNNNNNQYIPENGATGTDYNQSASSDYSLMQAQTFSKSSKSASRPPGVPHRLVKSYFVKPVLCFYCKDYIWGCSLVGMRCEGCGHCCHSVCNASVIQNTVCSRERASHNDPPVHCMPLEEWTVGNVLDWMAALNLYRYAELFRDKNITGADLKEMDEEKLREMGIQDDFHKKSLLVCIDELCGQNPDARHYNEPLPEKSPFEAYDEPVTSEHRFAEYNFSTLQRCRYCDKFLYGLMRQGLQCRVCGLCCHRCCSVTRQSNCCPDNFKKFRRSSFTQNSLFGTPLPEEVMRSQQEAPWVVMKCVDEIERWCLEHKSEAMSVYRISARTEEVNEVKAAFNSALDPLQVDISQYNTHSIAGALKKYLRELPDPIIPVSMYGEFIKAAKSSHSEESLMGLIQDLPPAHASTLRFLMRHFCRLWQMQFESGLRDGLDKLSQVFCHILLRPPWERIVEIVENTKLHIDIVEDILQYGDWGIEKPTIQEPPPIPKRSGETVPVPPPKYDLKDADWYWGELSREEVNEKLKDTPDGTFLVRDASTSGDYTLTLRKGGSNKLIKIYQKNQKYGFVEPLTFNSVVELIEHYRVNSLAIYNRALNTQLKHPITKPRGPQQTIGEAAIKEELEKLLKINNEYQERLNIFDHLYESHSKTSQELQLKNQALDAFRETVDVFEEQIRLHERHHKDAQLPVEVQKLHENYELLKRRLGSIMENRAVLEVEIQRQSNKNRAFISEMNSMKPELKRLFKQREQLKKLLIENGVRQDVLDNFLEGRKEDSDPWKTEPDLPHRNQAMWYVNCDRLQAQDMLNGRPDGTFLIRPKDGGECHALSIVYEKNVGHCKIHNKQGNYGFADPFFIHSSLMELVLHYQKTSLAEHNEKLDVMLKYPVKMEEDPVYARMCTK